MDDFLLSLAKVIRRAILQVKPPIGSARPVAKDLFQALKKARPVIEKRFGPPVLCRYSGCPDSPKSTYSKGEHVFKVLEYLWDFSLSRHAIPQAIENSDAIHMGPGKFELLLVAESELGSKDEICRDLLKLLEAHTSIRCLVYKQPRRARDRRAFEARMIRVLHNHAYFLQCPGIWLFVGLMWADQTIECDLYTLNEKLDGLAALLTAK